MVKPQTNAIKDQVRFFGYGSYRKLAPILRKFSPKLIFLVHGKTSFALSGAEKLLMPILCHYRIIRFPIAGSNPKMDDIERGISSFRRSDAGLVMGVGGGSAMDTAKAIALLARQKNYHEILLGNAEPQQRVVPTIIVPTTAGTGSESNRFIVYYVDGIKHSLSHPSSVPDAAIVDPSFTLDLPPKITATTGMDALAQAIESFWSVSSNEASRALCKKAIPIILKNLPKAVWEPDKNSRAEMLRASNLAGQAINITRTTAPHAVSYPMTSHFNVPHGQAVGLTLPSFLLFNYNVTAKTLQDRRGVDFVKKGLSQIMKMLGAKTPEEASGGLARFIASIGLETALSGLGIGKEGIKLIWEEGFTPDRMNNNPRRVTREDLRKILENIA